MAEVMVKKEGQPVKQFSVLLQNRVGSLSSLLQLVRKSGEDVIGLSMQDAKDAQIVRLIVTDPERVGQLFMEKGIPHTTCNMVVVALREVATCLEKCLDILKAGETNVDFVYSMLTHPDEYTLVAFHLDDHFFGAQILRNAGVKVMYQGDLSR
ncbi:MAG: hypothetical protein ACSHX6_08230 [Akkermansiaceae bacterium]